MNAQPEQPQTDIYRAARHAREVLDYVDRFLNMNEKIRYELVKDVIADLDKALAQPEQEPVAWMVLTQDDRKLMLYGEEKPPIFDAPVKLIPLYTAPPSKQEPIAWISEPMVAAVRRANPDWYGKWNAELTCTQMYPHQIPLYTAPPSKPWVSLTHDERVQAFVDAGLELAYMDYEADMKITSAIEAALKEKNT